MLGTLIFPAISALMSHIAGADEQGNVQGALHGAQSLAQAFGLLVFPRIYSNASGVVAFVVGGILNMCAVCLASWFCRTHQHGKPCTDSALLPLNGKER